MPLIPYKTGINSLGYDQWSDCYVCDWPDCDREADYAMSRHQQYCEYHFVEWQEMSSLDDATHVADFLDYDPTREASDD